VAAASTSNFLPLCKTTRSHKGKINYFTGFIGVNLENIIFVLLYLALFSYCCCIEINILRGHTTEILKKFPEVLI
jgi:hypothetical protein